MKTNKDLIGQTVWVLTGHSESGDDYGPFVFAKKPFKKKLKEIAYDWDGVKGMRGPGDFGSFVFLELSETEIE